MLEKIKSSLRVKSTKLDVEIQDLIEAAKLDLKISGVTKINEADPLIIQAVKTYCKANFGLDNKDSEKYQKSYDMLKQHLSLCGEYNVE
jgi:hypothetical protein|nr:MAG TPA: head to tail adaptor [Caudoviricetes sp.]